MTTYCTQPDMLERFGEPELLARTDRVGTGAIDPVLLARAIDDANAEVDAYVARRYTLPLLVVPPALKRVACDLARAGLYADQTTEEVRARLADARRFLRDIADGRVTLGVDLVQEPAPSLSASNAGALGVFDRASSGAY